MQKNPLLNVKDIRGYIGFCFFSKCSTSTVFQGMIQICGEHLQVALFFRFRSKSFICSPREAEGVYREIVISMYHTCRPEKADCWFSHTDFHYMCLQVIYLICIAMKRNRSIHLAMLCLLVQIFSSKNKPFKQQSV